jgi:hypothetical protein
MNLDKVSLEYGKVTYRAIRHPYKNRAKAARPHKNRAPLLPAWPHCHPSCGLVSGRPSRLTLVRQSVGEFRAFDFRMNRSAKGSESRAAIGPTTASRKT